LCDGSLSFCNFMAKVLLELPDDALASMPEDFVSDCCKVLEWSSTRALVFALVLPKPRPITHGMHRVRQRLTIIMTIAGKRHIQ
jgi:hypothetical protein